MNNKIWRSLSRKTVFSVTQKINNSQKSIGSSSTESELYYIKEPVKNSKTQKRSTIAQIKQAKTRWRVSPDVLVFISAIKIFVEALEVVAHASHPFVARHQLAALHFESVPLPDQLYQLHAHFLNLLDSFHFQLKN